jgi:lipopolysaccharide/colanic/teichoic acid biosynthesis glycosyltransferase
LGKFLRASRIDEIPQLYNVLKGEMSLVGPRPERPDLAKGVIDEIPEFKYRTLVKAGLTGLAQTMGRYDTSFKDKLMFDIYYVNNYSLILDLKILFYTLHTITKPSVTSGISENIDSIELLEKRGYKFKTDNNTIMVKYL